MKRSIVLIAVASVSVMVTAQSAAWGQEDGVLQRLNPFRLLRSRHAERVTTQAQTQAQAQTAPFPNDLGNRGIHSPLVDDSISRTGALRQQHEYRARVRAGWNETTEGDLDPLRARFAEQSNTTAAVNQRSLRAYQAQQNGGWLGQRTEAGNPPTLEELRAHLLSRGVDPASVEQRFARMAAAREQNRQERAHEEATTEPNLNQIRTEMEARGIDSRKIDEQIVRRTETRGFGDKFQKRMHGNGEPNYAEVRTRLSKQGVDPTSLNVRLGRSEMATARSREASRYGLGRTRR